MAREEELFQREIVHQTYPNPNLISPEAHNDFMRRRINVDSVIINLRSSLGGIEYNRKTKVWEQVRPPVVPEKLLFKIEGIIRAYVNENNIHGNINEDDARAITLAFSEELILLLAFDGPTMGVKNEDLGGIVRALETLVFMALSRAIGDGERRSESDMYNLGERKDNEIRGGKI